MCSTRGTVYHNLNSNTLLPPEHGTLKVGWHMTMYHNRYIHCTGTLWQWCCQVWWL